MLLVDRIILREVRLPLKEPFRISSGVVTERRIFLLELHDANGATTWSECVAGEQPNYTAETIDTAWFAMQQWIAPRVLGVRFERPDDVHVALDRDFRGHPMAKAAVEMGCWGLAATSDGVPLATRIGGTRDRVATGISLGIQATPAALVERAHAALAQGYRKIKVKIAPGADVAFVRAVRDALGADVHLMADANSAYTLADTAHLKQLDAFNLMMMEQPLAHDDIIDHAILQSQIQTPICLDECIRTPHHAEQAIALHACRVLNIKLGRVGGFHAAKQIHDFAYAHRIPVWCGGMLESGIGRAHNIALSTLPGFTLPGDVSASKRYWTRDIIAPPVEVSPEGTIAVPTGPGFGYEIDMDYLQRITVREEAIS